MRTNNAYHLKIDQLFSSGPFSIGLFRIQITLVLVFIFSRYWSKSIIRAPPGAPERSFALNSRKISSVNPLIPLIRGVIT